MSCNEDIWVWQDGDDQVWADNNIGSWGGIVPALCLTASGLFSNCFSFSNEVSDSCLSNVPIFEPITISGVTYSIADAFTDGGHGTGSHWHNTSTAGPPPPAVPTAGRYAEVGGFFGDEECRGISEFTKVVGSPTQALLKFNVVDMTLAEGGLSFNPIDGLYGQGAYTGTFYILGYQANGTEELPDFEASGTILTTINANSLSAGDTITHNITSFYNATSNYVGIRLQMTSGDYSAGAITFNNFRIELS